MRDGLRSRSGRCARERLPRGRRHGRRPRRPPPHAAAAGTGPSSAAPSTRDGIPRHRPAESCRHAAPSALWPVRTRRPYFLPQLPGLRGGRAGSGGRSVGASRARSGHPSSSSARAPECPGRRVTEACRVPWIDHPGPRRAQPAVPTSTAVEGLSAGSARGPEAAAATGALVRQAAGRAGVRSCGRHRPRPAPGPPGRGPTTALRPLDPGDRVAQPGAARPRDPPRRCRRHADPRRHGRAGESTPRRRRGGRHRRRLHRSRISCGSRRAPRIGARPGLADRPMARAISEPAAQDIRRAHDRWGVRLDFGPALTAIDGEGRVTGVETSDCRRLTADLVVHGIGVVPTTNWQRSPFWR